DDAGRVDILDETAERTDLIVLATHAHDGVLCRGNTSRYKFLRYVSTVVLLQIVDSRKRISATGHEQVSSTTLCCTMPADHATHREVMNLPVSKFLAAAGEFDVLVQDT